MKTIIAPETLSKEWQELVSKHTHLSYEDKLDDEMTIDEYARLIGRSNSRAREILHEEVEAGRMTRRVLSRGPAQIAVYRPIPQEVLPIEQEPNKIK